MSVPVEISLIKRESKKEIGKEKSIVLTLSQWIPLEPKTLSGIPCLKY